MSRSWGEPNWSAEETRRRFEAEQRESPISASPGESLDGDELRQINSGTGMSSSRPPVRKRPRTAKGSASTETDVSRLSKQQSLVRIKSEAEIQAIADLYLKPPEQRVKIYVGKTNAICEVGLEDLEKSPVLKSLVSSTGTPNPFIMHPELTLISADHFHSVREFLLTDEYMPAIMDNPKGKHILPKRLGECTTVEDYRSEALRGAHLYIVAKRLAMNAMEDLVFRKITKAQYQPYGIKCLLDVAEVIFSRPEEAVLNGQGKFKTAIGDNGSGGELDGEGDPLEAWLIEALGSNLQRVMIDHAKQFFRLANNGACAKRRFGVSVLRWKVDFWDAMGADVIAIEDDD